MLFFKKAAASGCGGCAVKSEGNCTGHLTKAAPHIARGFIDAHVMFDPKDDDHMSIVTEILAKDMRDEHNRHVAYDIPVEPKLREWFLGLISRNVMAGLNGTAPVQS